VAIWNFSKGTLFPRSDIRLWGTKGPSTGLGAVLAEKTVRFGFLIILSCFVILKRLELVVVIKKNVGRQVCTAEQSAFYSVPCYDGESTEC
jgi:hypothetical protein